MPPDIGTVLDRGLGEHPGEVGGGRSSGRLLGTGRRPKQQCQGKEYACDSSHGNKNYSVFRRISAEEAPTITSGSPSGIMNLP